MSRRNITENGPDPIDIHVGQRIRLRRTLIGWSQTKLAEAADVTFQQLQKYDRAANRVSASRLHRLAEALDVPISFFFDGLDGKAPTDGPDPLCRRETLELVRAYYGIENGRARQRLFDLVKAMGRASDAKTEREKA